MSINPRQTPVKRKKNGLFFDDLKIGYKYSGSDDTLYTRIEAANENVLTTLKDN